MDQSTISEFKALYLQTAKEYIAKLKQSASLTTPEMINDLFMSAHSLKSQSLVMQYKETGTLSGLVEKVGRALKEGQLSSSPEIQEATAKAIEKIAASVAHIESDDSELSTQDELHQLESASGISLM